MGRWCRPRGGLFQRDIVRNGVLLIHEEEQLQRAYLRRRMKKLNPTLQTIPEGSENEEATTGEVKASRFKFPEETRSKKKRAAGSVSMTTGQMSSMPGYYWVSSKIRKLEYCCVDRLARLALVL